MKSISNNKPLMIHVKVVVIWPGQREREERGRCVCFARFWAIGFSSHIGVLYLWFKRFYSYMIFFLLIFQLCFCSLSRNFLDLVLSNYLGPIDCRKIFIGGLARETTIGECFLFVLCWFVFFSGLPMSIRVINYFF